MLLFMFIDFWKEVKDNMEKKPGMSWVGEHVPPHTISGNYARGSVTCVWYLSGAVSVWSSAAVRDRRELPQLSTGKGRIRLQWLPFSVITECNKKLSTWQRVLEKKCYLVFFSLKPKWAWQHRAVVKLCDQYHIQNARTNYPTSEHCHNCQTGSWFTLHDF